MFLPVILCGGVGARLWPVSRADHPKQFMPIPTAEKSTENPASFLEATHERLSALDGISDLLVVCNEKHLHYTQRLIENQKSEHKNHFLVEPTSRNTAAAIAAATLWAIEHHGSETIMLVAPCDHLIQNTVAFEADVNAAKKLATEGKIVTFGIPPTGPETGYGYIQHQDTKVVRFAEKPNRETAENFLKEGSFLWNAGIFCFKAGVMLEELLTHAPETLKAARQAYKAAKKNLATHTLNPQSFEGAPNLSIDVAVMEKTQKAAVVRANFGWNDIGSWQAVSDVIAKDAQGNSADSNVLFRESESCFVSAPNKTTVLIGVKNLAVIDTDDAILVADKNHTQDVKKAYAELRIQKSVAATTPLTVHRPWGSYTVLSEGLGYKIKRIEVLPGGRLSLQSHQHRAENWTVIDGTAHVTNGDQTLDLKSGQTIFIPAKTKHRLENFENKKLVIVEVQIGKYLGEDDIQRFDDAYNRQTHVL